MKEYFSYINRLHILSHLDILIYNVKRECICSFENKYTDKSFQDNLKTKRSLFINTHSIKPLKSTEGIFSEENSLKFWMNTIILSGELHYILVGPFYILDHSSSKVPTLIPNYTEKEILSVLPLFNSFYTESVSHFDDAVDEHILDHTESLVSYSNDIGIMQNATTSYAIAEAIKSGDLDALIPFTNISAFTDIDHYDVGNALRKTKNLCLTSNTLALRAAEEGGAPLVYVRTICADFARRIEACTSTLELNDIRVEFLKFYCETVRDLILKETHPVAKRCYSYLSAHLSEDISMSDVAQYCNVSYEYLSRIISSNFQCSYSQLVHQLRIKRACIYLHSDKAIYEITEKVGYKNSSQFCHSFKKITGKTPKQWKKDFCIE